MALLSPIIPIISRFGKDDDQHIILSKQFLVSNKSSSERIYDFKFKLDQAIADFYLMNLEDGNYLQLILKYKKVTFDFSKLP